MRLVFAIKKGIPTRYFSILVTTIYKNMFTLSSNSIIKKV